MPDLYHSAQLSSLSYTLSQTCSPRSPFHLPMTVALLFSAKHSFHLEINFFLLNSASARASSHTKLGKDSTTSSRRTRRKNVLRCDQAPSETTRHRAGKLLCYRPRAFQPLASWLLSGTTTPKRSVKKMTEAFVPVFSEQERIPVPIMI